MKYYKVTFRWHDTDTFCSNIAKATSKEAVMYHYTTQYGHEVFVSECAEYDVVSAKERGMPIVTIG